MDAAKLRAWWWHRQGLDGSLKGASPAEVLDRSGWVRSVAGAGPYLTIFSRAGLSRQAIDDAVSRLDIHELPAARNCTYVVPAADFALALRAGQRMEAAEARTAEKIGVTAKELERLSKAVIDAVDKEPLGPAAIKDQVGNLARNLGPEGKKKGFTTTLPIALSRLQAHGEIRRVPVNARLDQQRYLYVRWKPNPLAKSPSRLETTYAHLAKRFFRWVGPATMAEFRWFSGLSVRDAQAAMATIELTSIEPDSDRVLLSDDFEAFRKWKVPGKPQYALVSGLDSILATRRNVRTLVDDLDLNHQVTVEKISNTVGQLSDLPHHAILDRGRLIGFWEYDFDAQQIVFMTFTPADKKLKEAVKHTEDFVRNELGDARSFSLDSPASRKPKIEAIRNCAARRSKG